MPTENEHSESMAELRTKKRKIDAAMYNIDQAVDSFVSLHSNIDDAKSIKSQSIPKSLYSTLAKYGITSKPIQPESPEQALYKTTPHLARILSRAALRKKKSNPFSQPNPSTTANAAQSEFQPSSVPSFIDRLSTFKLSTYANKPASIDAVAAARCGWRNNGKDRLACSTCDASWVVSSRDGMKSKDAAETLLQQQIKNLVNMHKDACPWRIKQCDPSIYRIPLRPSAVLAKEIEENAEELNNALMDVRVEHPLSPAHVAAIKSTIKASRQNDHGLDDTEQQDVPDHVLITAFFGWTLAPASTAVRPSPSRSGSAPAGASRSSTPAPSNSQNILLCPLCQRRVGLWAFSTQQPSTADSLLTLPTQRMLNLVREHRSHCPYVARTSIISPEAPPVEGWRAILAILAKHRSSDDETESAFRQRIGQVKTAGGRELLKYVKNLLA